MKDNTINGNWSLPNGTKYPGLVKVDKKDGAMTLEIYSETTLDDENIQIPLNTPKHYYHIIYGEGNQGKCTLFNCKIKRCSTIAGKLFKSEYDAEYIFHGTHLKKDFKVRSGKFLFPNLSSWYDGYDYAHRLRHVEGNVTEIDQRQEEKLDVNSELELIFLDTISSRMEKMDIKYSVEYNKYLIFNYGVDVPFYRLISDSLRFLKLLEFSLSKPLFHRIIEIDVYNDHLESKDIYHDNGDFSRCYIDNFSLNRNKKVPDGLAHQNSMVISKWKTSKEELNQIVINWFRDKKHQNIIEYYLDSNNWFEDSEDVFLSNVMFNNRFLNLIQGLEDYYRENLSTVDENNKRIYFDEKKIKLLADIKDAELKKWVNDTFKFSQHPKLEHKLGLIVQECLPIINELYGNISLGDFCQSAKDFRNTLSHGKNKNVNLGVKLHRDFQIAQLLLMICIMKTLNIRFFKSMLSNHYDLDRKINEIILYQRQNSN